MSSTEFPELGLKSVEMCPAGLSLKRGLSGTLGNWANEVYVWASVHGDSHESVDCATKIRLVYRLVEVAVMNWVAEKYIGQWDF